MSGVGERLQTLAHQLLVTDSGTKRGSVIYQSLTAIVEWIQLSKSEYER